MSARRSISSPTSALAILLALAGGLAAQPGATKRAKPVEAGAQQDSPDPVALAKAGKIDEATAAWRKLIAAEPKNPELPAKLVRHLIDHRRLNDALDACQDALKVFPTHFELLLLMGHACQAKGEELMRTRGGRGTAMMYFEDVVRYSGEALRLAPNQREPRALRGMSLYGLGRVEKAREDAEELVRRFPKHPGGYLLRAECNFVDFRKLKTGKAADVKKAPATALAVRKDLETAAGLDKERVQPHLRLGDLAVAQSLNAVARKHYSEALARDPSRGLASQWMHQHCTVEQRLEIWTTVLHRFDELKVAPKKAKADIFWHLGYTEFERAKWKEARRWMQSCWQLRPDYVNALYYHGLASYQLGERDLALLAFGTFAQKSAKGLADAINASGDRKKEQVALVAHYADLAYQRGNVPMSRDLNHAIALVEDTSSRWNNYAFLCRETQRYEDSFKAYEKALALSPQDPQLLNDAAVILQYHLHRDIDRAKAMYESTVRLGKRLVADKQTSDTDRKRWAQAVRDAQGNLAELAKAKKAAAKKAKSGTKKKSD